MADRIAPLVAGTPTQGDSYWLSQSTVFKARVQTALMLTCEAVSSEAITGITGTMPTTIHAQRKGFGATVLNPANFSSWLGQFTMAAACDSAVISAATLASTNYTPITSQATGDAAAAQGGNIPDTTISNAISASFNTFISGI